MQDAASLELGVGQQEAVGGDQGDARVLGPVREHLLQHARGRGLARPRPSRPGRSRTGVRGGWLPVQELLGGAVQLPGRLDVQAQQPGQRQVDLLHLVEVELVAETADALDLVGVSGCSVASSAKERPSAAHALAVELDVRRALARRASRSACASR